MTTKRKRVRKQSVSTQILTDAEKGSLDTAIKSLMTPEAVKEVNLNPTTQQFLLRFLDLRDSEMFRKLQTTLSDQIAAETQTMRSELSDIVIAQNNTLFSSIGDMMKAIEGISGEFKEMKTEILEMKRKQIADEADILQLKEWAKVPMEYDERMKKVEAVTEKVEKYLHPKWIIARNIGLAILTVSISLILFFQILNNKVSQMEKLMEDNGVVITVHQKDTVRQINDSTYLKK